MGRPWRKSCLVAPVIALLIGVFGNISAGGLHIQDRVGLLTIPQIADLNELVAEHDRVTTVQLVGAIVPSLEGMSVMEYGSRLFNDWGIGQKLVNNGGLIILAPKERQVGIITGYGLEWEIDQQQAQEVIKEMAPFLQKADYHGALRLGLGRMIDLTKNVSWQIEMGDISALRSEDIGKIYRFEAELKQEQEIMGNQAGKISNRLQMSARTGQGIVLNATPNMQWFMGRLKKGGHRWTTARLKSLSPSTFDLLGVE